MIVLLTSEFVLSGHIMHEALPASALKVPASQEQSAILVLAAREVWLSGQAVQLSGPAFCLNVPSGHFVQALLYGPV